MQGTAANDGLSHSRRGTADIYPEYENTLLDFPIGDDPPETYSRSILIQVTVALTVNCALCLSEDYRSETSREPYLDFALTKKGVIR